VRPGATSRGDGRQRRSPPAARRPGAGRRRRASAWLPLLCVVPLLILLLLGAASGCGEDLRPPAEVAEGRPPNLLLVTVDTLRADRLGAYGWERARTPSLDALAREGTLFEAATTPLPRTSPALASLFTALPPHEHGLLEVGEKLPEEMETLAEVLSRAGYATAGISANGAASRLQGLGQGFDFFLDIGALSQRTRLRRAGHPARRGEVQRAQAVTSEALAWLGRQRDEPWFLWLLYMEPHYLYDPPPEHAGGLDGYRHWFYEAASGFHPRHATVRFDLGGHSSAAREDLSRLYDGEVAVVDQWVGRLLDGLRLRDDAARTLVVFTADHGESLGEHGYFFEHGAYVYQPTMRVPLVFHWPGVVPAGRRVASPASLLDVAPTALGLLGLRDAAAAGAGRDLAPLWRGERDGRDRIVFGESGSALLPQTPRRVLGGRRSAALRPGGEAFRSVRDGRWLALRRAGEPVALYDVEADPALERDLAAREPERAAALARRLEDADPLAGRWRMATDGRFKLIRVPTLEGAELELYDLRDDPDETRDLAAERPDVVRRLAPPLEAWAREAVSRARAPGARSSEGDEETLRRLRALGYVE